MKRKSLAIRWILGTLAVAGLCIVFVFQHINWLAPLNAGASASTQFLVGRVVRFILNDLMAILLIYSLFYERKYVVFAVWVQLIGMVVFLLPYLVIKVNFPTYNGPLINYIHRFIVNPVLLLLMIPAFYFQRFSNRSEGDN